MKVKLASIQAGIWKTFNGKLINECFRFAAFSSDSWARHSWASKQDIDVSDLG